MRRRFVYTASFLVAFSTLVLSGCVSGPGYTPAASISSSLPSISFSADSPQTFTVSEPGYAGTFTATSSNVAVATVAAATSSSAVHRDTTGSATSSGSFTVTPVGGGSASITVSDTKGHSVSVPVSVTSAVFNPQLQR